MPAHGPAPTHPFHRQTILPPTGCLSRKASPYRSIVATAPASPLTASCPQHHREVLSRPHHTFLTRHPYAPLLRHHRNPVSVPVARHGHALDRRGFPRPPAAHEIAAQHIRSPTTTRALPRHTREEATPRMAALARKPLLVSPEEVRPRALTEPGVSPFAHAAPPVQRRRAASFHPSNQFGAPAAPPGTAIGARIRWCSRMKRCSACGPFHPARRTEHLAPPAPIALPWTPRREVV